jgi:hypothetical protein
MPRRYRSDWGFPSFPRFTRRPDPPSIRRISQATRPRKAINSHAPVCVARALHLPSRHHHCYGVSDTSPRYGDFFVDDLVERFEANPAFFRERGGHLGCPALCRAQRGPRRPTLSGHDSQAGIRAHGLRDLPAGSIPAALPPLPVARLGQSLAGMGLGVPGLQSETAPPPRRTPAGGLNPAGGAVRHPGPPAASSRRTMKPLPPPESTSPNPGARSFQKS